MISLEMNCPQLSRPEATAARKQNSIQDVHLSFFSHKETIFEENIPGFFLHIVDFNGDQWVEGPNGSFNAASKGSTL